MTEEVEKVPEEDNTPDGRAKRLTSDQWARIETLWELGVRTKEIVAEFGVSNQAVTRQMSKRGIVKNSKAKLLASGGVVAPIKPAGPVSDFEQKRKERIEKVKELMHTQNSFVGSQTNRLFADIHAGHKTLAGSKADLQALKLAGQAVAQSRENFYAVLNIENDINEQDLPTLVFEDLTKDEIKVIQAGTDDDLDSLDLPDMEDEDDVIVEGDDAI